MANKSNQEIAVLLRHKSAKAIEFPADHLIGGKVPVGGSNCAKCPYLASNKKDCTESHFIKWNGGKTIPGAIQAYCCDFFPVT